MENLALFLYINRNIQGIFYGRKQRTPKQKQ